MARSRLWYCVSLPSDQFSELKAEPQAEEGSRPLPDLDQFVLSKSQLREATEELEDRLEGVYAVA